jgi:hypothetical protein
MTCHQTPVDTETCLSLTLATTVEPRSTILDAIQQDKIWAPDLQVWVELRGFEPLTPSMRTRCATGLRYSPKDRTPAYQTPGLSRSS